MIDSPLGSYQGRTSPIKLSKDQPNWVGSPTGSSCRRRVEIVVELRNKEELKTIVPKLNLEKISYRSESSQESDSSESSVENQFREGIFTLEVMAAPAQIPVVMRLGDEADRPYSLVPFPSFYGPNGR